MLSISGNDKIWVGGGDTPPTHNAPEGSRFFLDNPVREYVQLGPGVDNNWAVDIFVKGQVVATGSWVAESTPYRTGSGPNYQTIAFGVASGTDFVTISQIEVLGRKSIAGGDFDLRVSNDANGDVIAEGTAFSGVDWGIRDLGTVSNQPTGDWIYRLDARCSGGGSWNVAGLLMKT